MSLCPSTCEGRYHSFYSRRKREPIILTKFPPTCWVPYNSHYRRGGWFKLLFIVSLPHVGHTITLSIIREEGGHIILVIVSPSHVWDAITLILVIEGRNYNPFYSDPFTCCDAMTIIILGEGGKHNFRYSVPRTFVGRYNLHYSWRGVGHIIFLIVSFTHVGYVITSL